MSLKVTHGSNRRFAEPGTCNQKGNKAPRFQWPDAIRVLIHTIAHFLDYTDDQMLRLRKRPNSKELHHIFCKTVPWFAEWYDTTQLFAASEKDYDGGEKGLGLFAECPTTYSDCDTEGFGIKINYGQGPAKVDNRLLYLFTEPKTKKKDRSYGRSVEHPENNQGNRRATDLKCRKIISKRLKLGKTISPQEIDRWSVG